MTENDDLVLSLSIGGGGASQTRRLSNPLQIHHSPLLPTSWDIHVASSMSDLPRRPEIGSLHKGMEVSEEDEGGLSSPNSAVSSVVSGGGKRSEREELLAGNGEENEAAGAFARGISDDEDGGEGSRKKLRLSKEQSAVLEESFKEHNTLNPMKAEDCAGEAVESAPETGGGVVSEQTSEDEAEADGGGLRTPEAVLRESDGGESPAAERGAGASSSQVLPAVLHARDSADDAHHVPFLRARGRFFLVLFVLLGKSCK